MTVRAWFTISAVVLVALAAAFVFQLFSSVPAPEIVVRTDTGQRLDGALAEACWPQRGGELACQRTDASSEASSIPPTGTFRIVFAHPAQPEEGRISIKGPGRPVNIDSWRRSLPYDFEPGTYTLTAQAGDPQSAFVRYVFRFTVMRSGS